MPRIIGSICIPEAVGRDTARHLQIDRHEGHGTHHGKAHDETDYRQHGEHVELEQAKRQDRLAGPRLDIDEAR